ncbi:sulfotransferase family protein [Demequina iriomotensis]|uniref:sulfotransferase family protein n=1 Tax=Demequina iriomotensis TaxID=1536641 RepID=UPI0007814C59|nr:sulfotransferase [Demequina iriomotensis]
MTAMPNTFIVGAPKCGTTALAQYLSERPDVFFSQPKEPHFWATDIPKGRHEMVPANLAEYRALFAAADPATHAVIGEGSTSYLRSSAAVPAVLGEVPEARFIAMLRDPVEVVQAFHGEQYYVRCEDLQDFEAAWRLQDAREQGHGLPPGAVGDQVLYRRVAAFADQVERFFAAAPEDQRLVLLLDDLRADPAAAYARALDFLGLPRDGRTEFAPVHQAHAPRFPALSKALLHPPKALVKPMHAARMMLLEHDTPAVRTLKGKMRVEKPREAISPALEAEIRAWFAPDVARLEDLLGRDLSTWKATR